MSSLEEEAEAPSTQQVNGNIQTFAGFKKSCVHMEMQGSAKTMQYVSDADTQDHFRCTPDANGEWRVSTLVSCVDLRQGETILTHHSGL